MFCHGRDYQWQFTEICPGTYAIQNTHKQTGKGAEQQEDSFFVIQN